MRQTTYAVRVTVEERAQPRTLIGQGTARARLLTHARILLKADQGEGGPARSNVAVAGAVEVQTATVGRVRRCFVEEGLEAALHRKAPARRQSARQPGERRRLQDSAIRHRYSERTSSQESP